MWSRVPYVRFDFHSGTPGDTARPRPPRRHLWDRRGGAYRLEQTRGDTVFVVLFNVNDRRGRAYANGAMLPDSAQQRQWRERAYETFINDTYWLLAPTKLFDAGVTRAYAADSSSAATDVLNLSFGAVGLTPGDRYWLYVDRATGRLDAWRFFLQDSEGPGPKIAKAGWKEITTPFGTARIPEQNVFEGTGRILYTDHVGLPTDVNQGHFTVPSVMLE